MRELEQQLGEALAALCSISVSGPAVVPLGRAMAAVSRALELVQGENEAAQGEPLQVRRTSVSPDGEGQTPRQTSGAFAEEGGGARERGEPRRTAGESGADFAPTRAGEQKDERGE